MSYDSHHSSAGISMNINIIILSNSQVWSAGWGYSVMGENKRGTSSGGSKKGGFVENHLLIYSLF